MSEIDELRTRVEKQTEELHALRDKYDKLAAIVEYQGAQLAMADQMGKMAATQEHMLAFLQGKQPPPTKHND